MSTILNVVSYMWKTLSNGEHPLMVRVCKDGKRRYLSLGISVNPIYWDFKKDKPKPNCSNKEYIDKIIIDITYEEVFPLMNRYFTSTKQNEWIKYLRWRCLVVL